MPVFVSFVPFVFSLSCGPLFALPAGALGGVLEDHALRGHGVADAVRLGEVAGPAGGLAGVASALYGSTPALGEVPNRLRPGQDSFWVPGGPGREP